MRPEGYACIGCNFWQPLPDEFQPKDAPKVGCCCPEQPRVQMMPEQAPAVNPLLLAMKGNNNAQQVIRMTIRSMFPTTAEGDFCGKHSGYQGELFMQRLRAAGKMAVAVLAANRDKLDYDPDRYHYNSGFNRAPTIDELRAFVPDDVRGQFDAWLQDLRDVGKAPPKKD